MRVDEGRLTCLLKNHEGQKKKSAAGRRQSCHGSPNVVPPRSGSCEAKLRHVKLLRSTVTTIWSVRICLGFVKHTVRSCLVFVKLYAPLYNLRYNVSCCFAAFAPSGRRDCSSQRYRKRRLYEFDFGRWDPLARSARRAKPARARWTGQVDCNRLAACKTLEISLPGLLSASA